jgi:hypothetical protein
MIKTQPFTTDILATHRGFFILDKLPKFAAEVDIWVQTPAGNESVDFVDIFTLQDGTLLAAWAHPFQKLPLHNLTVFCDGVTQVLNLYLLERVIDIYERPLDSTLGTFVFTKSVPIDGGDWRCDRGTYGVGPFKEENVERVISELGQVVVYEPFISVNGVAHILYLQATNKTQVAEEKINNSISPATGRTLQETMRLIYEWSILAEEPFSSTDDAAVAAKALLDSLGFTTEERTALASLPPMQISNYLAGSETARVRPSNIPALDDEIKTMVFKRMASSSLSALFKIHGIEDTYGLQALEQLELDAGIQRFNDYYSEPVSAGDKAFFDNQVRFFKNKQTVLDRVSNNAL